MASITTIPTELLRHILAHVADNLQSDIRAVRLVCKQFNEVAAPLRVRNWSDDRTSNQTLRHPTDIKMVSIDRFAVELLRYPELRSQVRSLKFVRLMSWEFYSYEKPLQQDGPRGRVFCQASGEDLVMLAKAAEKELPHLSSLTNLCEQIRYFHHEAVAILVIAWATNLESLSLAFGSFHFHMDDDILVSHFAKHVAQQFISDGWANRHLPMEKLRHLEFLIGYNPARLDQELELGDNLKFLVPFLHLPRLKTLKCWAVRTECEYRAWSNNIPEVHLVPFPNRTSSIESVELVGPSFSTLGLGRFLQAFKTLKSLKVKVDGVYPQITRGPCNDGSLPRVLIEHASSLEELDLPLNRRSNRIDAEQQDMIDFEKHLRPNERLIETDELPECYKELTHVRKLGMPVFFRTRSVLNNRYTTTRLTPSHLPESIEHLTLYNTDEIVNEDGDPTPDDLRADPIDVLSILREAGEKGRLSQLKSICCTNSLWGYNNEAILAIAEERGVEWVWFDDTPADTRELVDFGDDLYDEYFE
ncbi:hypothetical protein NW768_008012 [Fusarium equiseti]|uniref:F-box domain-containing protein n=1 Tax=Fusarium equiseti TaxID=61235 RepID=A0ABQ8R5W1_FUSEQ|nr:hypothetical protein NW768_008012 [Fusarium equiseti]